MSIYTALLFQQGYIQNTELALSLAADDVGERNDATPPPDAAGGERDADCGRHPRPFRPGAIASICSVEPYPFRSSPAGPAAAPPGPARLAPGLHAGHRKSGV